jgi:triacylglycerol lipase
MGIVIDWEMRGARGIEFGVDLPAIPAIGLGVSTSGHRSANGDGWGLRDWGRFVGAWKKEEKIQQDAAAKAGEHHVDGSPRGREQAREQQRKTDEAIVKSSTDKLSAVFDWLTDQVPSPPLLGTKAKMMADAKARTSEDVTEMRGEISEMQKHMDKEEKGRRKNELATKKDLEQFYVALSKKLYDEGL